MRILEQAEQELSTWIADSVLSRLNRHPLNTLFQLSKSLCPLFRQVVDWNRKTGSAFDPAVGSLMELRGLSTDRDSSGEIFRAAQEASGMKHLQFDPSRCQVMRLRDVRLDPGGSERARPWIGSSGTPAARVTDHWLIDFGGQLLVLGSPPEQSDWRVDLAHPHRPLPALLELEAQLWLACNQRRLGKRPDRRQQANRTHTRPKKWSARLLSWVGDGVASYRVSRGHSLHDTLCNGS